MHFRILSSATTIFTGYTAIAAELPSPMPELTAYFQQTPSLHVGVILTNYRPTAVFRSKHDFQKATQLFGSSEPPNKEVSYFEYASSESGMIYKEVYLDPSQTLFPPPLALSTNPLALFLGRSTNVWWYATAFPKTPDTIVMAFNALMNSGDGIQTLPDGHRNPYFRTLILDEGSLFSHLKLGPFAPNTFQIPASSTNGEYIWTAKNDREALEGTIRISPSGEFELTRSTATEMSAISVRMRWDRKNQLPAEFFILNPDDSSEIYQSYTRIESPIGLWESHPDCFHYAYHTNAQDLITLHQLNGDMTPVNYIQTPKEHREGPGSFLNRTFAFVFFVVSSGFLLAWFARRKAFNE